MAELDNIEKQITETLSPFAKKALEAELSDGDWTKEMMKLLRDLGKENGYGVSVSGLDKSDPEWLFDMTWWKYGENESLMEVPLVIESEWNRSIEEIKYDFEKLIIARSDHRLMIFQSATKKSISKTIEYLIQIVKNFNLSIVGDRYLFVAYCEEEGEFLYELYIYE